MKRWILTCVMLLCMSGWTTAHAQTCTITVNALSSTSAYDPFAGTDNITQGSFSVSCTRPSGNGGNFPASFWVGLSNGSQLKSGSNVLNYGMYQDYSACSNSWGGTAGITFSNSAGTGNGTKNVGPFNGTYCFRINSSQISGIPSASYSDTWTISVNSTSSIGSSLGQTAFNVTTRLLDACSLRTPPTNMTINYTSFDTTAGTGTDNFAVRCTNSTPYTLALDQTSVTDNALNLVYTLALSANSGTGSGVDQSYTITGTMAAGQVGTCASANCNNNAATNKNRTLTVSY